MQKIALFIGTGMCGFQAAVDVLNRQLDCTASFLKAPFLPWDKKLCFPKQLENRLNRLRRKSPDADLIVDAGWFYLPHVEQLLQIEPNLQIACLQRPQREIIDRFLDFLKRSYPVPTTYWKETPPPGWQIDPHLSRTYPDLDSESFLDSISDYWTLYRETSVRLAEKYPQQFRIFETQYALDSKPGLSKFLEFLGYPEGQQRIVTGRYAIDRPAELKRLRPMAPRPETNNPLEPCRCLILVPYYSKISMHCNQNLKELEKRGYVVRRVQGYAAIDQARNQLATDALIDGFEETLWIDADCHFDPADVDKIRSHQLPICCAVDADLSKELTRHNQPSHQPTSSLVTVPTASPMFLHIRRQVYNDMQIRLPLPVTNEHFQHPVIPFFRPMHLRTASETIYLNDIQAFSQRVRMTGYTLQVDTSLKAGIG